MYSRRNTTHKIEHFRVGRCRLDPNKPQTQSHAAESERGDQGQAPSAQLPNARPPRPLWADLCLRIFGVRSDTFHPPVYIPRKIETLGKNRGGHNGPRGTLGRLAPFFRAVARPLALVPESRQLQLRRPIEGPKRPPAIHVRKWRNVKPSTELRKAPVVSTASTSVS
jgi:hypothetical protein